MSYNTFDTRQDGAVLHVDFNNAPLNLMTIEMVGELFDLAGALAFDAETKVVVFGSAVADFFIAHFDITDMFRALNDPTVPQSKYDDINVMQALTSMLQALPQITIAKVDGICRGGGLEFLLATSMRFATPESRFCFPEVSGGFLPTGGGTTRLAMQIGPARAMEILLSSGDFSGTEAAQYGLLNRVLLRSEIDDYVENLAQSIAAQSASAIAEVRNVFQKVFDSAIDAQFAGFAVENTAMHTLLANPDVQRHLERIGALQDREHELDLPATIAALS